MSFIIALAGLPAQNPGPRPMLAAPINIDRRVPLLPGTIEEAPFIYAAREMRFA
jgi:hypothetical protein